MTITNPLVLPTDVVLIPVEDLSPDVREQVECEDGDYAITRRRARTPSSIIDAQAADLLKEFRSAKTIVEAVISYSQAQKTDPEGTLDEAFPMIQRFVASRLLVPPDSQEANAIVSSLGAGDRVAQFSVLSCIQVLEDSELYQAKNNDGDHAALKIAQPAYGRELQRMFDREAAILKHLDGSPSPQLLQTGTFEGRPYLALEWCSGINAAMAAGELRQRGGVESREKLLGLSCAILEAYSRLHAQGVIHSDVHPRNLLVDSDGSVKIIDYGLARLEGTDRKLDDAHRGGVGFFLEPEYAKAHLANRRPPPSSFSGEQYALASLLYLLFTGAHYLDFSLEKNEMLRQIAEVPPLPFSERGVRPWPGVEEVLARALSKDPSDRFPSVSEFARRLGEAPIPGEQADGQLVSRATTGIDSAVAETLLSDVLQRVGPSGTLLSSGVSSAPTCSINFGAAGIAYALYRIACVRSDAALLSLADLWSNKALRDSESSAAFYNPDMELTPEIVGHVSPYHTASGVHAARGLVSHAMGDSVSHQEAIEAFVSASQAPCDNLDLTLGRSGVLLTCSLLLDTAPDNEALRGFGAEILRGVWDQIDIFAPVQECSQLSYLGIAHGWAGMLYATMRWCQSSKSTLPAPVEERLDQLAECAEPVGRGVQWRTTNRERGREHGGEYMPGWCHGSAGHVFLWTLAHRMLRDEAYLRLAEGAAWNAWEVPNTVGSLCCGLAGQAYGLLNLYKHTGEGAWVYRALELANRAPFGLEGPHSPDESLYKGKIGVAVLAAELSRPEVSCMPLFEEEGWPRAS